MPKNETPKPASRLAKTGVRGSATQRKKSGREVIVDDFTITSAPIPETDRKKPHWYFVSFRAKAVNYEDILDLVFNPRGAKLLRASAKKG